MEDEANLGVGLYCQIGGFWGPFWDHQGSLKPESTPSPSEYSQKTSYPRMHHCLALSVNRTQLIRPRMTPTVCDGGGR